MTGTRAAATGWQFACVALALCVAAAGDAAARDLGTHGATFMIEEPDMRAAMIAEMLAQDLDAAERRHRENLDRALYDRAPIEVPPVSETRTESHDLSITLTRDVYAPVRQPDGRWRQQAIARAGQRINPMDSPIPKPALLFVDARDPEQLRFMDAALAYDPATIVPIITAGVAPELAATRQRPVYYASEHQLRRLRVAAVPALVQAGSGDSKGLVLNTYFAMPAGKADVQAVWTPLAKIALDNLRALQ